MNDSSPSFQSSMRRAEADAQALRTTKYQLSETTKKLSGLILLVGLALLFIAGVAMAIAAGRMEEHSIAHHIIRDIGVALLVAAVITAGYEVYARVRFETMLMNSFLGAVIADWSRQDIWDALNPSSLKRPSSAKTFVWRSASSVTPAWEPGRCCSKCRCRTPCMV